MCLFEGGGDFGINPRPNINIFYKFHHLVPFYKSLHIFEEKKRNSRRENKKYRKITIYVKI